jgi:4-amino-4-deoxychorismate lyase
MCLFIETIRIDHGKACNLSRHNRRLNDTRAHFWPESTPLQLRDHLSSLGCEAGIVKARVVYGEKGIEDVSYSPYTMRHVHSLALIQADHIDYTYKSAGREPLNRLFALRDACDDILIVKQGLLTDTSIANIAGTSPAERNQTGSLAGRRNLAGKRHQTGRLAFILYRQTIQCHD